MFTTEDIAARVRAAQSDNELRGSGLLFHGTAEPFETDLRTSSHDDVLWFAESPLIAQLYIPESGISSIVSKPDDWRLGERVRPNKHSFWTEFATLGMKRPLPEVQYDHLQEAVSWTASRDWPTYAQCVEALSELGYAFTTDTVEVKSKRGSGEVEFMPADYLEPGRVFVTVSDGLNLLDLSVGEGDLQDPMHRRLDIFRKAEDRGFDGIIIDDFAQSSDWGNVGHRAIGLFAKAVQRPYVVYSGHHRMMEGVRSQLTVDFLEFAEELECSLSGTALIR